MKCRKAYGIMPVGENDRSAHVAQQKAPEVATPGLFYSVLGGWLNPKAGYQLFFSVQPFADVVGNYTCQNRERKITVKLSDADCDRLARKCGEHGLTIGELIENFVGDLVGGTYSNGSDERDYADQWFERCWFGMFPEPTLLNHLLNLGYEPEHYLDMLENVETIKSDIEITKQNIAEPSDEWKDIVYHKYNDDRTSYECVPCYNSVDEYIASEKEDLESYKADLEEALEELKDMIADWKPEKEPNMDEEIELIKKWVKEREDFINE